MSILLTHYNKGNLFIFSNETQKDRTDLLKKINSFEVIKKLINYRNLDSINLGINVQMFVLRKRLM